MATSTEGGENDCPICLGFQSDPVETNCAHKYCAKCILSYWETAWHPAACQCPYCRRKILLLMPVRTAIADREIQRKINNYNRQMYHTPIPITTQVRDSPTILRHVFNELVSLNGISLCNRLWIILALILALLYLISPVDLIPELILGPIGFIDDIVLIFAALIYIAQLYRRDIGERNV